MSKIKRSALLRLAFAAAMFAVPAAAHAGKLFITSANVNLATETGTFPVRHGLTAAGGDVSYIVLDASTSNAAQRYGVNRSNKLANARNTVAVQKVSINNGVIVFPATVDFAPDRVVVPGPGGFPPTAFQPGAVAGAGYSPLIQLPDGTILNAPHIANASGAADKVVRFNAGPDTVEYRLTPGYVNGSKVLYISTDASDPLAAALEGATLAPQLGFAPGQGNDGTDSSRAGLATTINGQTGASNPERQGFNSALLDGLAPLNTLAWSPNQGRYSPLWDVHLGRWSAAAVAARRNVALKHFSDFFTAAKDGDLTAPDGGAFGAVGIVVDCPIVMTLN
jgi:hypothetical protein